MSLIMSTSDIFRDPAVLSVTPSTDYVLNDPAVISAVPLRGINRQTYTENIIAKIQNLFKDPAIISAARTNTKLNRQDLTTTNLQARRALVQLLLAKSIKRVSSAHGKALFAMASRFPVLNTSNLPTINDEEAKNTISPARGTAMKNQILKQLRVPEFRFLWQFWAEKGQSSAPPPTNASAKESADAYASRPKPLGDQVRNVKDFYEHYNNIPTENLKNRGDSIHLFHLGVKPLWEDPRNARGGAYYFRVSRENAAQFWHEICVLAVGDVLQGAVETKRDSFNDEICGVSYSLRWNAVQIAIWNRDSDNEAGVAKLLETVLEKLSEEVKPKRKEEYWYKAHRMHKGFAGPVN